MITLDWTLLATGVVFLLTLWLLNRLLFRPLFQILDRRRELTSGTEESAAEQTAYQKALVDEYSEKIKAEKQQGYQLADSVRKEAMEFRRERLASARQEAGAVLEEAKQEVEREIGEVRSSLRIEAKDIARMIASRVLEKT